MYLSEVKLWNFRKFGSKKDELDFSKPDLEVPFTRGLNVLIGENDSGKTAIIDAIKLVLDTHSSEWVKLTQEDFYKGTSRLRIECQFKDFCDEEAMHFIEWLGMDDEDEDAKPFLKVILDASKKDDKILPFDISAGADDEGHRLLAGARYYLKTIYFKPLRDAKSELIPRRSSRLSQILSGHPAFKSKDEGHILEKVSRCLNCLFQKYFRKDYKENKCTFEEKDCPFKDFKHFVEEESPGKQIQKNIQLMINRFLGNDEYTANFGVIARELKNILEQFKLSLSDEELGLGSHNLLFIAAELMNLQKENWSGLRLALIEELEAHLEPQRQMRLIEYFEEITSESNGKDIQIILTTHSPNLASKVKLENLTICHDGKAFPTGSDYTELVKTDYAFLERFLDVTKANLFFAKGVILVEGWAEELILPVLARKIRMDLTQRGVSVVNIGNTAFLRYAKIFQRKDGQGINLPVAVVSDLDIKPDEESEMCNGRTKKQSRTEMKENKYNGQKVKTFVSPHWTLEYCIARSGELAPHLYEAIKASIKEMQEDGASICDTLPATYTEFAKSKNQEDVALEIYNNIAPQNSRRRISKAILSQHFARILEKQNITESELNNKDSTKYLIDAIKYVTE